MDLSSKPERPRRFWLTLAALVCASVSGVAIVLHAVGWLPMSFLIDVCGPLSLVLLLILGIYAKRINEQVFLNRLVTGAWAGLVATLAYDAIRYPLWVSGLFSFNPFASHPIFGVLITGRPRETMTAIAVGWIYHFWNGVGFGIMYTLIAGKAHWYYAVIWALFLEIAWLTALPSAVELRLSWEAVAVSLTGHGAYGVVLGLLSRRFVRL